MTLRTGATYAIQDLEQFRRRLDADWTEIAEALPAEEREAIVQAERGMRAADGVDDEVETIADIGNEELSEFIGQQFDLNELVINTLEERDREYTHVREGHVHKIIELYPTEGDDE